jgi:hypothetical protein
MGILDKAKRIRLYSTSEAEPAPRELLVIVQPYEINELNEESPPPTVQPCDQSLTPPAGARLFFGREDGRPCAPDGEGKDAPYHWTWERAPTWFYTREVGLPAWEMRLRLGLWLHCKTDTHRGVRVVWRDIKDGRRQLRCECAECGKLVKMMKAAPDCPDVEFIATGKG